MLSKPAGSTRIVAKLCDLGLHTVRRAAQSPRARSMTFWNKNPRTRLCNLSRQGWTPRPRPRPAGAGGVARVQSLSARHQAGSADVHMLRHARVCSANRLCIVFRAATPTHLADLTCRPSCLQHNPHPAPPPIPGLPPAVPGARPPLQAAAPVARVNGTRRSLPQLPQPSRRTARPGADTAAAIVQHRQTHSRHAGAAWRPAVRDSP